MNPQGDRPAAAEGFYTLLVALFTGLLVIANVLAVKPATLPWGGTVPAGVLVYSLTFPVTDVVAEVWGKERSRALVWAGLVTSLVAAAFVRLAIGLPPAGFWDGQEAYAAVLDANGRLVAASMVAYLTSQLHDVWAFHLWRRVTRGRHLWLRNNASTMVSQLLDSTLFVVVAFYGVWPSLFPAIRDQYLVKLVIAALDTPLVYAAVRLLRAGPGRAGKEGPAGAAEPTTGGVLS